MKILADDTARVADNMTRLITGEEEAAPTIEQQTDRLMQRHKALRILTSDSKEAIKINDDFFETFGRGIPEEDIAKNEEERIKQMASLKEQIHANLLIIAEKEELKNVITDIKRTEVDIHGVLKEVVVPTQKIAESHQEAAKWATQTTISLATSALAGDNLGESLKRAAIQLAIMVAQAKIYAAIMASATPGGFLASIG